MFSASQISPSVMRVSQVIGQADNRPIPPQNDAFKPENCIYNRRHRLDVICSPKELAQEHLGSPPALQLLLDGVELKAAGRRAWYEAA